MLNRLQKENIPQIDDIGSRLEKGFYQHYHGGIYQLLGEVKNANDGEWMALYIHIYPFESSGYVRPLKEFSKEKYKLLSNEEFEKILNTPKEVLIQEILESKKRKSLSK